MSEGKVAGTFTAKITLREPAEVNADDDLRLPTGVGLETLIQTALQDELVDNGNLLFVSAVTVERTDA